MASDPLNMQVLPQVSTKKSERILYLKTGLAALIAAVIIGLLYWWGLFLRENAKPLRGSDAELRSHMSALLDLPPQSQASTKSISNITDRLSVPAKTTASPEQRASIMLHMDSR